MRFISLRARGLGAFAEVAVDFEASDAAVVSVTGPNGAGKTTLLELLIAGVYRQTPTRGSLASLAGSRRDAFLQVVVDGGPMGRLTMRHNIDGVSGKADAVAVASSGEVLTPSGKVTDFDAFVTEHFPPLGVVLATQFAAQGSGGFLAAKPAERKGLLLRLLGTELLESFAGNARREASDARNKLAGLQRAAQLNNQNPAIPVGDARWGVEHSENAVAMARDTLAHATSERDAAKARAVELDAQQAAAADWDRETARIAETVESLLDRKADLESSLAQARVALRQKGEVEVAVASLDGLEAQGRAASDDAERARQAVLTAQHRREVAAAEVERLTVDADGLQASVALAQQVEPRRAAVEAARERVADAELVEACARRTITSAHGEQIADATERVGQLRGALTEIADAMTTDPVFGIARDALEHDDDLVERAEQLPGKIATAEKDMQQATNATRVARQSLTEAESYLARAEAVADAPSRMATTQAQLHDATERRALAARDCERLDTALVEAVAVRDELRRQYTQARQVASLAPRIASAEAQLAAADVTRGQLDADIATAEQARSALGPRPSAPTEPVDTKALVRDAEAQCEQAARNERAAADALAAAKYALQASEAKAGTEKRLQTEIAAVERELADWNRLAADLGKNGLQAALVDSALPEINRVANDLLAEAFGPRFALDLRTQTVSAKGKPLETLDVIVHDSERAREASVESFSGGERAILAEGLSLALTTIACREAGVVGPTIVRDEAGAALDELRARQWVQMMRRAGQLIGASQILFVSHSPAGDGADSTIAVDQLIREVAA